MNEPPLAQTLQAMHTKFCELTGTDPRILRYLLCERQWYEFARSGFTIEDLELVLKRINAENRNNGREYQRSLKLSRVIGDPARFAEDLAEAVREKQRRTTNTITPREQAVGELRGFAPCRSGNPLRSVGEIMKTNGLG